MPKDPKNYSRIATLKAVPARQEPFTNWRTGVNQPGYVKVGDVEVWLRWDAVERLAQNAVRSKGKRASAGPLLLRVKGPVKTTELSARQAEPAHARD
jgi:hypothetical protein